MQNKHRKTIGRPNKNISADERVGAYDARRAKLRRVRTISPKVDLVNLKPNQTHGLSKISVSYSRWVGMRRRCRRGYSTVCKEWNTFENFYKDMGEPPLNSVLDRIDNQKGYFKENCRWTNFKQSTENRTNTIWIIHNGEKLRVNDFSKKFGFKPLRIYARLKMGQTSEDILNNPPRKYPLDSI